MNSTNYSPLQIREVFHLEFLRWLGREVKPGFYAVKGGANLRFFFKSFRYSEDMDLDIHTIGVRNLKDVVMDILNARDFSDTLRSFDIGQIVPPTISRAKQTATTQRFKVHVITAAGEDLFTKIEFSRRGLKGTILVQPVSDTILRAYKMAPLLVPHYDIHSLVWQKIDCLATRAVTQARDIFDLFVLSSQYEEPGHSEPFLSNARIKKALANIFTIEFQQYRDTVVSYLLVQEQVTYDNPKAWDEVRLKTAQFVEEISEGKHA